jgi:hypothetical protein
MNFNSEDYFYMHGQILDQPLGKSDKIQWASTEYKYRLQD